MIKKIFLFFIVFSVFYCLSSDDEESVAVRTELVVHLEGGLIGLHDILVSSESGNPQTYQLIRF